MSYRALYEYAQQLSIPVSRKILIEKVCELTGKKQPRACKSAMDETYVRGYFVAPGVITNNRLKDFNDGRPLIVVNRGLNRCWERFVFVKELMHYFDSPLENVSSGDEFDALLNSFTASAPDSERSDAFNSELKSFWMALGVLCPETIRQEYVRQKEHDSITDLEIATALRIPQLYITHLSLPNYKSIISSLIDVS
jgi:hypothetical protein